MDTHCKQNAWLHAVPSCNAKKGQLNYLFLIKFIEHKIIKLKFS